MIAEQKTLGRTVFFSSHELSEVETLCDRVIMIHKGRVVRSAPTREILGEAAGRSLEDFFIDVVRGQAT